VAGRRPASRPARSPALWRSMAARLPRREANNHGAIP
jgi:hypothetical protein